MRHALAVGFAVLVLGGLAASARAEAIDSFFDVWITGENTLLELPDPAKNNGYNDGTFYFYPQTGWWNEWFFNDPEIHDRWKEVEYHIIVDTDLHPPMGDLIEVVINWSTPEWGDPSIPPLPDNPLADDYIVRTKCLYTGPGSPAGPVYLDGTFTIDDYNPVWVSIDVRATDAAAGNDWFNVSGIIRHECLPEPATLALVAAGGLTVLARRRRR